MNWTNLTPPFQKAESQNHYLTISRTIEQNSINNNSAEIRRTFGATTRSIAPVDRQIFRTSGLVLFDLYAQGWLIRTRNQVVQVRPPDGITNDRAAEKHRIRQQELVKRNAQLRKPSTQKFIKKMEHSRLHNGQHVSVLSLMRDGRELAKKLAAARTLDANNIADALQKIINPYIQFVTSTAQCEQTGFRLMDIWRYFRHTWINQYTTVPGRNIMFLVRDAAADGHPVIGIGSLTSPVIQIQKRDNWIGWHPDIFLRDLRQYPTTETALWLIETTNRAINEIYVTDFIEDRILTTQQIQKPTTKIIARLITDGKKQRLLHHQFTKSHKKAIPPIAHNKKWETKARSHLFRSKRALALADYLQARELFQTHLGTSPTADALRTLAQIPAGANIIRKIVKKAKSDKIGISIANISVCGAVQPYNAILGGKLVSMLATSPEILNEYRKRYTETESKIASSMAGRGIVRPANLVMLETMSLYGTNSSQYNRVRIPCNTIEKIKDNPIRFQNLGHSEAFGTSQYSDETVSALNALIEQSESGPRIANIFGEGMSPRLRKIRQGLNILNFSSDVLMKHHRRRIVYAIALISNLRDYLLNTDKKPLYLMPQDNDAQATNAISDWWRKRWLQHRIESDNVLRKVAQHTLVQLENHGARIVLPP